VPDFRRNCGSAREVKITTTARQQSSAHGDAQVM
jgi:hypothetical protein